MRKISGFVVKVLVSAWFAAVVSSCGGGLATLTYSVGGTISGISSGSVVLQNNGGNDLTVSSDGRFTFTGRLPADSAYLVTVASAPSGVTCAPSNASGTVGTANVTNVSVVCSGSTTTFDLSVTHSGIGAGTVTSDVGDISCTKTGGTCTGAYDEGATVVLTATADSGYVFSGWNGSGCTGAGTCTVTVSSAKTVRATFIMVAFASERAVNGSDAVNTNTTTNIWVMKTDGTGQSALTQTTAAGAFSTLPKWSPDGSQLVFESRLNLGGGAASAANDVLNIWVINADGTGLTALTQTTAAGANSSGPEWSPDGSQLVFESQLNLDGGAASAANDASNIWMINADGTGLTALTQLTAMLANSDSPRWSPDGTKIAFSSARKLDGTDAANDNNVMNVWVINADGTGVTALTQTTAMSAESFAPEWSPDGSQLVFESRLNLDGGAASAANAVSNIWVINADGTGLTALTSLTVMGTDSTTPQWFPDGSKVLFSSSRDTSGTANADVRNVWLLDVNTLGVSNLTQTTAVGADANDAIASQ